MARRTLYLNDQDDLLYLRAKELADATGETLAGIFVEALKVYIANKEEELNGFKEINMFIGEKGPLGVVGEKIVFSGRFIGSGTSSLGVETISELFITPKKKYVLWSSVYVDREMTTKTYYDVFESIEELKKVELLPEISEALWASNVTTRRLDV